MKIMFFTLLLVGLLAAGVYYLVNDEVEEAVTLFLTVAAVAIIGSILLFILP